MSLLLVINIVPLCEKTCFYSLLAIPNGKQYNAYSLRALYWALKNLLGLVEMKVVSIAGDGDSVLRSFQLNNYSYFPHDQAWHINISFAPGSEY